jgi:hypothetical protein
LAVKRKPAAKRPRAKSVSPRRRKSNAAEEAKDKQIEFSTASLHELFQQQVRTMLDRSDLDEEQKQGVLVAASCPCCGAGGLSFTVKLRRRK